ncbi:xanthine dehydrogenase small subunit [Modestobacter sp. DSM 44400]|uniref:xanthine dehydrogenase small subunit n=1 Tax=Modestobacter sp. DSM 44400 TaxID=1550230 RepID=UPI00089B05AE|nr:FAD binding domain-containing protein [Modestobacter sp. DSM 44400]SDX98772.1 xanthine dehydrogenase small subunit [Modestobacter sp. DSM 44400]
MPSPTATVNGQVLSLSGVDLHTTVLDWLRSRGLLGCKEGCAEGECGACSVLVARPGISSPTRWTALNACLLPVLTLDGQELITAEGLGAPDALHPVQREMAVRGGSQCGYCTPGFVCSMAAEFYRPDRVPAEPSETGPAPSDHLHGPNGFDLHALSGNLCRCTGYRPIRDAAFALGAPADDDRIATRRDQPPPPVPGTRVAGGGARFARPAALTEALNLIAEHPGALLVAGSTDWGVDVNLRAARAAFVVAIDRLPELRTFRVDSDAVEIGAALTLSEAEELLDGHVPLLDQLFPQFASRLIRNGATMGGNLGTGSPIGDTAPALLALDASLILASANGEREVLLADYFTGYRRSVRLPGELIRAVRIPLPQPGLVGFSKVAKRRFDDISSVAVAFGLDVEDGVVRRARIGLGGVAATPLRARATEDALTGRPWTAETVRAAADVMAAEGTPLDDHRASARYRSAMLRQALLKFHAQHETPLEVGA